MAKGAGKQRGQPKKVELLPHPTVSMGEEGECSNSAAMRDTSWCSATGSEGLKQQLELEIQSSVGKQAEDMAAKGGKEAKAMNVEEGEAPPMRRRGIALGYVAPTINKGIPTAKLVASEIDKENEKWKQAVILYVIGETPTIAYLKSFLQKQCEIVGTMEFFLP